MTLCSMTFVRRALAILSFALIAGVDARADVLFTGITDATLTVDGWTNLVTGASNTNDITIVGAANVDLQTAASSGGGTGSSSPTAGVLGNPAALDAGEGLTLFAQVDGGVTGLGTVDAWALTSGSLTIANHSTAQAYEIFFTLDYFLSALSQAALLSESAFAQTSIDVFTDNETFLTDVLVSDSLNGGGDLTSGSPFFFSLVLAQGSSVTLNVFADAIGSGIGVEPVDVPGPAVPEPATGTLVLAGVGRILWRRRAAVRGALILGVVAMLAVATPWMTRRVAAQATSIQSIAFTRIAQLGDDPPGITGPLTSFGLPVFGNISQPAVDETRRVVFIGRDATISAATEMSGVFVGSGGDLFTVADRTTDSPGVTGPLRRFGEPGVTPFGIVFSASDASFRSVILSAPQGPIVFKPIAQFLDSVPMTSYVFNGVGNPTMSGAYIAFSGNYLVSGQLKRGLLVGRTISTPGSIAPELFTVALDGDDPPGPVGPLTIGGGFNEFANRGTVLAFTSQDANFRSGIFTGSFPITTPGRPARRTLRTIISSGEVLPNGGGVLQFVGNLANNGVDLAFNALGDTGAPLGRIGVYTVNLSTLAVTPIVQAGDDLPGPVGAFEDYFPAVALSDEGFVAFWAQDPSGNQGLFVSLDGEITKIVDSFDIVDGKRVAKIYFGAQGVKTTSLAYGLVFQDGSQAIYRADLTLR